MVALPVYLPYQVSRKVFCLRKITLYDEDDYAYLDVIIEDEEGWSEEATIVYNYSPEQGFPKTVGPVITELAQNVPIHMCGFEVGLLAQVQASPWGGVCPCQLLERGS